MRHGREWREYGLLPPRPREEGDVVIEALMKRGAVEIRPTGADRSGHVKRDGSTRYRFGGANLAWPKPSYGSVTSIG
jgi:hypothetical protein